MYFDDMMIITGEEAGQFDHRHDFYEKIEAPKFVDFTAPERCHPDHDDRYWFCMRVGCDRKHEEEIDPKEIDKKFILRVMAARSPNVRARRALDKKNLSTNPKCCPQTTPPKSSISRRVEGTPLAKLTPTPNVKPSPRPSQSVKKPKPLDVAPKTNVVAKTPLRKTCSVVSKPQKRVVGDVKPRGFDSGHGDKSSRCESGPREDDECSDMEIDENSRKGSLDGPCRNLIETFEFNDSRGCEALNFLDGDGKSERKCDETRRSTSEGKMVREGTADKENADDKEKHDKVMESTDDKGNASSPDDKEKDEEVMNSIDDKKNASSSDNKEKDKEVVESTDDKENASSLDDKQKDEKITESTDDKENATSPYDKEKQEEFIESTDEKKNTLGENVSSPGGKEKYYEAIMGTDNKENVSSRKDKEKHDKVTESDDKENASVPNANREQDCVNQESKKGKILGKHKNSKCIQKAMQVPGKAMKETSGPQVVKYEKPKPTNPKPFRLRTDERQILKEAKLEKKLNTVKEVTTITKRTKLGVPQEREKELKGIITRKDRNQDQLKNKASLVEKQVKDVTKRTKPPLTKQPGRPQWVSSIGKEKSSLKIASDQLSAIHETTQIMLKHKKAPSKKDALLRTKPLPSQPPHYILMGKCMYQDSNLKHHSYKSGLITT